MNKQELIDTFLKNHQTLVSYVNSLSDDQFTFSNSEKWTAGQQLSHAYICLLPFLKVLPSKEFILQKFGKINRATWSYDEVIENYLKTNLKAPDNFLPGKISPEERSKISNDFLQVLSILQQLLNDYTDEELDTLVLPHPLLGTLSIREMFYLMSYHPIHHLRQAKLNLEEYPSI